VPVYLANPDRVKPHPNRSFAEAPEEAALRTGIACSNNPVYRNGCASGCFVFLFGGTPPNDNACDDMILPATATNRFICTVQSIISTFSGGSVTGAAYFRVRQMAWTGCPDDPTSTMLAQGDTEGIPNDGADHVITLTIDPPHFLDVGVPLYQEVKSDHVSVD